MGALCFTAGFVTLALLVLALSVPLAQGAREEQKHVKRRSP